MQKGLAGMGFQISLEIQSFSFVRENTVVFKIPVSIFPCVGAAAAVVVTKAGFQIGSVANVNMFR